MLFTVGGRSPAEDPDVHPGLSLKSLNYLAGILRGTELASQFTKKFNGCSSGGVSAVGVVMKGDLDA
jgi:hypothetical protein